MSQVGFGVDFGTTNSVIGICEAGRTRALLDGDKPNPSVVWFKADGTVTVGSQAKRNINGYAEEPGHTFISSVKANLGKGQTFRIGGESKSASEVATEIFRFLLNQANNIHGISVPEGFVTIPVDFDGKARRDLRRAAESAGYYIKTFIHEPFAAVAAYCLRNGDMSLEKIEGKYLLVFDWGGGTLDITLALMKNGILRQLGTAGLGHRAGDYFDQKLMRLSHHRFLEQTKLSPEQAMIAFGLKDRYLAECERVKIELSNSSSDDLQIASAFRVDGRTLDVSQKVLREDLEAEIQIDITDAIARVDGLLDDARLSSRDVDLVLLIGGSSRIPILQRQMQERFGSRIVHVDNADTIIAEGAALVDYLGMHPVLARSLGVKLSDGSYYELFPEGTIAKPELFRKTINFYCTDGRDGEAKLVLIEKADGQEVNSRVLGIPVDRSLPRRNGDCERVSVTLELDSDLILHVFGKAATQSQSVSASFHDLLFALDTQGARK